MQKYTGTGVSAALTISDALRGRFVDLALMGPPARSRELLVRTANLTHAQKVRMLEVIARSRVPAEILATMQTVQNLAFAMVLDPRMKRIDRMSAMMYLAEALVECDGADAEVRAAIDHCTATGHAQVATYLSDMLTAHAAVGWEK